MLPSSARRQSLLVLAAFAITACGGASTVKQSTGLPYDSVFTESLGSGVVHRRLVANSGPFTIHVVEANIRRSDLTIAAAHAFDSLRGRALTSAIVGRREAEGRSVIAAINADFFDLKTGENENNQVVNGEVLKAVPVTDSPFDSLHTIHSQFAVTCDGHPLIERFTFAGAVLTPPPAIAVLPLDAVNFRPRGDAMVLYTAAYGMTPADSAAGQTVELPLRVASRAGDTLRLEPAGAIHAGGGLTIPRGQVVLSGAGATAELVRRLAGSVSAANPLRIVTAFLPKRGRLCTLVGGWPRLVVDGRSIADSVDRLEGTFPRFSVTRHPRTGVGFSRDSATVYFITVDGRSESSSGMSLAELASLMQSLGVAQGLNLDGGGSTTLVIRDHVVNHPSDSAGERTVGNALMLVKR